MYEFKAVPRSSRVLPPRALSTVSLCALHYIRATENGSDALDGLGRAKGLDTGFDESSSSRFPNSGNILKKIVGYCRGAVEKMAEEDGESMLMGFNF